MIFLRDEEIKNCTDLAMTNEDTNFTVTNLTDDIIANYARASSNTTTISGSISNNSNSIAILGHNLTTATGTATLKLYDGVTLQDTINLTVSETIVYLNIDETYDNFELILADSSLSEIYVGKLIIGDYVEPTVNSKVDFVVNYQRNDKVFENETGQKYTQEGIEKRSFSYSFPKQSLEDSQNLRTFWRAVGKHEGFLFMNFNTDLGIDILEPCFVFFTNDLEYNFSKRARVEFNIEMEEGK